MNKREAKRLACFASAQVIQASLDVGWPFNAVDEDEEQPYCGYTIVGADGNLTPDGQRLEDGILELVDELFERGYK